MAYVSVPLRGNGWERRSTLMLDLAMTDQVSVPLRGNGWESSSER